MKHIVIWLTVRLSNPTLLLSNPNSRKKIVLSEARQGDFLTKNNA